MTEARPIYTLIPSDKIKASMFVKKYGKERFLRGLKKQHDDVWSKIKSSDDEKWREVSRLACVIRYVENRL